MFSGRRSLVNGTGTKVQEPRRNRGLNLALLFLKNKDFQDAERAAENYLLQEQTSDGYRLLGETKEALNKKEEALLAYEKSIELDVHQEELFVRICDIVKDTRKHLDVLDKLSTVAENKNLRTALAYIDKTISSVSNQLDETPSDTSGYSAAGNSFNNSHVFSPSGPHRNSNHNHSHASPSAASLDRSIVTKLYEQETAIESLNDSVKSLQESVLSLAESVKQIHSAVGTNSSTMKQIKDQMSEVQGTLKNLQLNAQQQQQQPPPPTSQPQQQQPSAQQPRPVAPLSFTRAPAYMNQDYAGHEQFEYSEEEYGGENYEEAYEDEAYEEEDADPEMTNYFTQATSLQQQKPATQAQPSASQFSFGGLFSSANRANQAAPPAASSQPTATTITPSTNSILGQPPPATTAAPTFSFGFGQNSSSQQAPAFSFAPLDSSAATSAFKFGLPVKPAASTGAASTATTTSTTSGTSSNLFAGVAQTWNPTSNSNASWLSTAAKPIFGQQAEPEEEDEAEENVEEENDNIHFKPVVPLPPKVDVVTGEEGLQVKWSHRAKLYRFTDKEWKERGLGDLKVMYDPSMDKYRMIMRRDQVHKVCLNQYITAEMKLTALDGKGGEKPTRFQWTAMDYSEGEGVAEVFAVRFKNGEIAAEFEKAVKQCQSSLDTSTGSANTSQRISDEPEKEKPTKAQLPSQTATTVTPSTNSILGQPPPATTAPAFSFGFGQNSSSQQAPAFSFAPLDSSASSTFKFGLPVKPTASTAAPAATSTNLFAGVAQTWNPTSNANASWLSTAAKPIFGQQAEPEEDDDGDDNVEEENDNIHFKPVVPLPPKVDILTGEEGLQVQWSHRAKLYRYTNKEWKERGLGDLKVMYDPSLDKYRMIMRRDQVHKVCLNQYITAEMKLTALDGKGGEKPTRFQWTAMDYSEGEGVAEVLAVRFKNGEIAAEFEKAVKKCQSLLDTSIGSGDTSQRISDDSDITVVYEKKPSKELIDKALKLKLPLNFYNYMDCPNCKGCPGCDDEKFVFAASATRK